MKVLLTHRFFWPDTAPYAVMLRPIGDALAQAGHEVQVLSSMPSYQSEMRPNDTPQRETLGALYVRRIRVFGDEKRNPLRRLANVALYCWALFITILRLRPDMVTASTFPPVIAAWTASLAARLTGARFVYHMQDIHPEVSQISGGRLGRGLPMRAMRWLDNQTLRRSNVIVVLSLDMADTLRARGLGDLPVHVINNFSLDTATDSVAPPANLLKPEGRRRAIFAGNLGRFQNLAALAEGFALSMEKHPDLELLFLGNGIMEAELKHKWGGHPQVAFAPFLPFAQAKEVIKGADIGLVSLMPGIQRAAYPSKIITYLDLGLPLLVLVEPDSRMASDLAAAGLAEIPATASAPAIAEAVERLLARPERSEQIQRWRETEGSTGMAIKKLLDLIESTADAP